MTEDSYYLGAARLPLETDQEKARLIHRLRQYLEVRNFAVLIGNGCSLPLGSQRPSELSRTVLAQCNSFIVHRIQNPDDQEYFRSVISGINRELLDQLPALAQQHAIVLGDCVSLPLQVRINTVDPRPRSDDPPFTSAWTNSTPMLPDIEAIADRWTGTNVYEERIATPPEPEPSPDLDDTTITDDDIPF